jgi:hypothetical protein
MADESIASQIARQRVGKCRHFNGLMNDKCEAGVVYDELRKDGKDLPCFGPDSPMYRGRNVLAKPVVLAVCGCRSAITPEEAEAAGVEAEKSFARIGTAIAAICKEAKGRKGISGSIKCPCCEGTLKYSIAGSNGHIHARCSTKDCVSFMQ